MTTFYDLLNINQYENNENIKISYKNQIKIYKFKNLSEEDILKVKQLKTALLILTNDELKKIYDNLLFNKDQTSELDKLEILPENSGNDNTLDSLFSNIINNTNNINIPNCKSKSLEKANNYMTDRIFHNIAINDSTNKIVYNSIMPIQTREDRKLAN